MRHVLTEIKTLSITIVPEGVHADYEESQLLYTPETIIREEKQKTEVNANMHNTSDRRCFEKARRLNANNSYSIKPNVSVKVRVNVRPFLHALSNFIPGPKNCDTTGHSSNFPIRLNAINFTDMVVNRNPKLELALRDVVIPDGAGNVDVLLIPKTDQVIVPMNFLNITVLQMIIVHAYMYRQISKMINSDTESNETIRSTMEKILPHLVPSENQTDSKKNEFDGEKITENIVTRYYRNQLAKLNSHEDKKCAIAYIQMCDKCKDFYKGLESQSTEEFKALKKTFSALYNINVTPLNTEGKNHGNLTCKFLTKIYIYTCLFLYLGAAVECNSESQFQDDDVFLSKRFTKMMYSKLDIGNAANNQNTYLKHIQGALFQNPANVMAVLKSARFRPHLEKLTARECGNNGPIGSTTWIVNSILSLSPDDVYHEVFSFLMSDIPEDVKVNEHRQQDQNVQDDVNSRRMFNLLLFTVGAIHIQKMTSDSQYFFLNPAEMPVERFLRQNFVYIQTGIVNESFEVGQ